MRLSWEYNAETQSMIVEDEDTSRLFLYRFNFGTAPTITELPEVPRVPQEPREFWHPAIVEPPEAPEVRIDIRSWAFAALIALALFFGLIVGAISASAAPLTPINAPPAGEGDTLAIVADFCPECVRMPDTDDLYFREPGERWYIFAFEDLLAPHSDFDFNDLIVWASVLNGNLVDWGEIASYTDAQPKFEWLFGTAVNNSTGAGSSPVWSVDWANLDGQDHVVTWTRPLGDLADVPEPGTLGLLLIGLGLLWRRKR